MAIARPNFSEETDFFHYVRGIIAWLKANNFPGGNLPVHPAHAAATPGSGNALIDHFEKKAAEVDRLDLNDPYFGRIDLADGSLSVYVGTYGIKSSGEARFPLSHSDVLRSTEGQIIVSAMSSIASKFYTVRPDSPLGVARKRLYEFVGGELLNVEETLFMESESFDFDRADEFVPSYTGRLKRALEATRTNQVQAITATITPEQYEIIDLPISTCLSLQGGPGTGKSVVALHRLATLAYRIAELETSTYDAKDLLFIAPSQKFLNYVKRLVPEQLGQVEVAQREFGDCFDYKAEFQEASTVLRQLKGDLRMADLLQHAVWMRMCPTSDVGIKFKNVECSISAANLLDMIELIRREGPSYNKARSTLHRLINDNLRQQYSEKVSKILSPRQIEGDLVQLDEFLSRDLNHRRALARLAPNLESKLVLRDLKQSPRFFRDSWVSMLAHNPEGVEPDSVLEMIDIQSYWPRAHANPDLISDSDVPLLVELDYILENKTYGWRHISVDEAQDRLPMELRAISRLLHSGGGLTLLGDLAQATGSWYYENWDSIWSAMELPSLAEPIHRILPIGFRVPRSILEYADQFRQLLDIELEPLTAVKVEAEGLHRMHLGQGESLVGVFPLLRQVFRRLPKEVKIGIVARDSEEKVLREYFDRERPDALLEFTTLTDCKGMEYDVFIVCDPVAQIAQDLMEDPGTAARKMWVAYTRGTKVLVEISPYGRGNVLESIRRALHAAFENVD